MGVLWDNMRCCLIIFYLIIIISFDIIGLLRDFDHLLICDLSKNTF